VITSFVVGLAILSFWPDGSSIHPMFPAVALSMLSYVGVALYGKPVGAPEIGRFFAARAQTTD
jgi:hypothetical protein